MLTLRTGLFTFALSLSLTTASVAQSIDWDCMTYHRDSVQNLEGEWNESKRKYVYLLGSSGRFDGPSKELNERIERLKEFGYDVFYECSGRSSMRCQNLGHGRRYFLYSSKPTLEIPKYTDSEMRARCSR